MLKLAWWQRTPVETTVICTSVLSQRLVRFRVLDAVPASAWDNGVWLNLAASAEVTFSIVDDCRKQRCTTLQHTCMGWLPHPADGWMTALAERVGVFLCDPVSRYVSILLTGGPATGKTYVARYLMESASKAADVTVRYIDVLRLFEQSGHTTDAASVLAAEVKAIALHDNAVTALLLDNVDALTSNEEIPAVWIAVHALSDALESLQRSSACRVLVLSLCRSVAAVHPMLLRASLLQGEIIVAAAPSVAARRHFLQAFHEFATEPELSAAVEITAGWLAPQLLSPRSRQEIRGSLRPTQKTDGQAPLAQLYGVSSLINELDRLLLQPLMLHEWLDAAGISVPRGALVVGPSGSGKTALMAALQRHLALQRVRWQVIMRDGLSLLHKEVGRSEKNIQALLDECRACAPCLLFLDNLDALAPPRNHMSSETNVTADRTLSTLLVELDGVRSVADKPVVVIASAPSVASLDAAMVRPGRLDLHFELALPDTDTMARMLVEGIGVHLLEFVGGESSVRAAAESVFAEAANGRPLSFADVVAAVRAILLDAYGNAAAAADVKEYSLDSFHSVLRETFLRQ